MSADTNNKTLRGFCAELLNDTVVACHLYVHTDYQVSASVH